PTLRPRPGPPPGRDRVDRAQEPARCHRHGGGPFRGLPTGHRGRDVMTWVRVDTGIFRNRKVAAVTPPAKLLYTASLCWAADTLSDGHIPERALATLGAELGIRPRPAARQLVEVGLWEPVEDGWMIPDFTAHNPSRAQVEARRAADRARKQQAR